MAESPREGTPQPGVGVPALRSAKAGEREEKNIRIPGSSPVFFLCLLLPATGARCRLLTPECGSQQIPLLQVRVREGGR